MQADKGDKLTKLGFLVLKVTMWTLVPIDILWGSYAHGIAHEKRKSLIKSYNDLIKELGFDFIYYGVVKHEYTQGGFKNLLSKWLWIDLPI